MKSRIKYKPGELNPEIHLTLTLEEYAVIENCLYSNMGGVHPVRDSIERGVVPLSRRLWGGWLGDVTPKLKTGKGNRDVERIVSNLPELKI